MTGIVDITAVALLCITGARLAACRSGSLRSLHDHRWHHEYDRCEMVCGDGVLFALIKVLAIVTFLVVGTVFPVAVSRWMATPLAFI